MADPHYELGVQDATIKKLRQQLAAIKAIVDEQAEDEGLWFRARRAPEAYLQQALRRLHETIEEKTSEQYVAELLATTQ